MASFRIAETNFCAYIATFLSLLLKHIGGFSKLQQSKRNLFNFGTKIRINFAINFNKKSLYANFLLNGGILIDVETL